MRQPVPLSSLGFALLVVAPLASLADDKNRLGKVPAEVAALEGAYTGSWVMYGIDGQGDIVKKMAWTDIVKAGGAEIKGDRAQVKTTDEMTFEGAKGPPFKVEGKEGYFLRKDGTPGDYFIETFGQVNRLVKVGDNVWSYTAAASPQELARLGFPKGAAGRHVIIKVVGKEQGVETHRISRLSTVSWTDRGGQERVSQFVSLQGYHKREP
jgi:hypothetical protein